MKTSTTGLSLREARAFRLEFLIAVLVAWFGAIAAAAQTYEVLHAFAPRPPASPYSPLIIDASGTLYGTSAQGGSSNEGTVFELRADGTLTTLHGFGGPDGAVPYAGLIQDDAGNLYGATSAGGGPDGNAYGTVFKIDTAGTLTTLHAFTPFEQGANLRGSLILDGAGNLYGTAAYGGASHYGIVFKIDPSGAMTTIHTFGYVDGSYPMAGLIADGTGNLYGTTSGAGQNIIHGTIFRIDAAGNLTTLHFFNRSDGAYPLCSLIRDVTGNLYGTTSQGGPNDLGTVFRLDTAGTLTTLYAFAGPDGANPQAALILDEVGNLYGTTTNGGASGLGTVFRLDASGNLTTVHSFNGSDGSNPASALLRDTSGNLLGTTAFGGAMSHGTVFQIAPSGELTILDSFATDDPAFPRSGLVGDDVGDLFGTSSQGGRNDQGTIFKLDNDGVLTTLHSFAGSDGASPRASLIRDSSGNLYGTTRGGGDGGTLFEFDISGTLTTLHFFSSLDGSLPETTLVRDGFGNLFGTTSTGGAHGGGTIYEFNPPSSFVVLHSFGGTGDGSEPQALTFDSGGNLYGATASGGYNYGTVFQLDSSAALTTLHYFLIDDGAHPLSPIIPDGGGSLFGTASEGGANELGTIFKLDAAGALTTLHQFDGSDGQNPAGNVVLDSDGNLYGTTAGTVFELSASGVLTTLHRFENLSEGIMPVGGVIRSASGDLYGTTSHGGSGGTGVIFRISPLRISTLAPAHGPAPGGTVVQISGTGFRDGAVVTVGGTESSGTVVLSSTEIQTSTPTLLAGTLNDVTVANPGASSATLGQSFFADFVDVVESDPFHDYIEEIFRAGITAGCGGGNYCPDAAVTRAQMAAFLLKAEHGSNYLPPDCTGVFGDVACPSLFADWIEQLAREGITAGCGSGNYCPASPVTRAQMAVFLLKAEHGAGYLPPACNGVFGDVSCPSLFAGWIEQLAAEGITSGCGGGNYCPANPNTRGQMAVFLTKTFHL